MGSPYRGTRGTGLKLVPSSECFSLYRVIDVRLRFNYTCQICVLCICSFIKLCGSIYVTYIGQCIGLLNHSNMSMNMYVTEHIYHVNEHIYHNIYCDKWLQSVPLWLKQSVP